MVSESILLEEENRLRDLAKSAWAKTMVEFYYPPLEEPNFVFDYTHKEGFYIDPDHKWQITMNLANTPEFLKDEEFIDYYYAISLHEVSHYQVIPYDGLINAKLLKAAMTYVNRNLAPIVVNVFADLIIDYKLHQKYPELMEWELKETYGSLSSRNDNKFSDFAQFLFRSYEKMWEKEITNDKSFTKMDTVVNRVVNVIKKDIEDESTWEEKVSKVAYHMRKLTNDTFTLMGVGGILDEGKSTRQGPGGQASYEIPEDVLEIMDNPLENKNSDKLEEDNEDELRQKAEEFAKDTPFSDFGAPAGQAGLFIDGDPLATWYRGIAKDLIQIRIFEEKPGGQMPI